MCFSWYVKAFTQKYAMFDGRAHRTEFWCFTLFSIIGYIVLLVVDYVLGLATEEVGVFSGIFVIINLLPSIAISVRRLHDGGFSGWWYFLIFVPIIGFLAVVVFSLSGSKEDNKYGKKPTQFTKT